MRLFNTLTRSIEEITPIAPPTLGLYACGFTVYDYTHLGHLRKYTMDDVLIRSLRHAGFQLKFVQNITDVGHLSSDADTGEDKLEKGARKYNKTVWNIAKEFEQYFFYSMDTMGNVRPDVSCRATEHIPEQIALVNKLAEKGFAYRINDGIYFDTSKFPTYGELAKLNPEALQAGARVEVVPGKKNVTDFALWKFSPPGQPRQMEWYFEGPLSGQLVSQINRLEVPQDFWSTIGFPGWHIECSAMAMEYLGQQFDIHTGGIDHIPVHHTNEIAQAEAATGKQPFVRYWVHHNHLMVEGTKMSKSLGNFFTIDDVTRRGFDPMALRLLFLSTHYRSQMNFTWENLAGAQTAWKTLSTKITQFKHETERSTLSEEKLKQIADYRVRFFSYIEDDLRTPEAVALMWEVFKSNIPSIDKYDLIVEFDEVLGLGLKKLDETASQSVEVNVKDLPEEVQKLLEQREQVRAQKNWNESDRLRDEVAKLGYKVLDTGSGLKVMRN